MDYDLTPRVGLGPVRLGMSRGEVRAAVGQSPKEVPRRSGIPMDFFVGARLQVEYGADERCIFVQSGPGSGVLLGGKQLMARSFLEVSAYLGELDDAVEIAAPDLTSEALQIAVYAGSAGEDPDAPVEAVAVFAPGYYGPRKAPSAPTT